MSTPLGAVLFDLDGTLADTLEDIANAVNHALDEHGLPGHPIDAYRELVGEGVGHLVSRAISTASDVSHDSVLDAVAEHYLAHILDHTTAYEGVPELLDTLTERGVPMAILSNKPEPATRHIVDDLFGRWSFVIVAGGRDGVALKPDPAPALEIARRMGVEAERVLYLGDTCTDMDTAVAAGMYPVGALWGFRGRDELLRHGARALAARPGDVLEVLEHPDR